MDKRYVAIYTTVLFPPHKPLEILVEDGILVNKEVSSIEEAYNFFKEQNDISCWNRQIYDKETDKYVY